MESRTRDAACLRPTTPRGGRAAQRCLRGFARLILIGSALGFAQHLAAGESGALGANPKIPMLQSSANKSQQQLALARLCERRGEAAKAQEIYASLIKSAPKEAKASAHHRLAVMACKDNHLELAENHFRQALTQLPQDATLLSDASYFYYLREQYSEAEKLARRAIDRDAKNQAAKNNLGLILGRQGKFQESYAAFRDAGPEAQAANNLAFVYAQQGDIQKAEQLYSRSITLNPKMKPAAESLVQIAQHKDRAAHSGGRRNADAVASTATSETSDRMAAASDGPMHSVARSGRSRLAETAATPTATAQSAALASAGARDATATARKRSARPTADNLTLDGKPLGRLVAVEPIQAARKSTPASVPAPAVPKSGQAMDPLGKSDLGSSLVEEVKPAAKHKLVDAKVELDAPRELSAAVAQDEREPHGIVVAPAPETVHRIPIIFGPKSAVSEDKSQESSSVNLAIRASRGEPARLPGTAAAERQADAMRTAAAKARPAASAAAPAASASGAEVQRTAATLAPKRLAAAAVESAPSRTTRPGSGLGPARTSAVAPVRRDSATAPAAAAATAPATKTTTPAAPADAQPRTLNPAAASLAKPAADAAQKAQTPPATPPRSPAKYSEVFTASDEPTAMSTPTESQSAVRTDEPPASAAAPNTAAKAPSLSSRQRSTWATTERPQRSAARSAQNVQRWSQNVFQRADKQAE